MIYAETSRLHLRALEEADLPRLVELIGDWDVAKWMIVVPHPYHFKDGEEFFAKQNSHYASDNPEFFAIIDKANDAFMGGIGLHPAYVDPRPDEIVLGYWLGKPFWGEGFMTEAAKAVADLGFKRPEIMIVTSTTDPDNRASQNVLRKTGLKYLGIFPRIQPGLRGGPEETRWELSREDHEKMTRPS